MINQDPHEYAQRLPTLSNGRYDEGYFEVWSNDLQRAFTGSTLTIARHNRSEAERVAREHHAKNTGDNNV